MIKSCGFCGGLIDTQYGSFQVSPDFPDEIFCYTLAGGRDNCLEKKREDEVCKEGLHIEYKGDICPGCGLEIKHDPTKGN